MGISSSVLPGGLTVEDELVLIIEYLRSRRMSARDAFLWLDTDRSGFVAWPEFLRGVEACVVGTAYTAAANPDLLAQVFNRFDTNRDRMLDIAEFTDALTPKVTASRFEEFRAPLPAVAPGFAAPPRAVAVPTISRVAQDVLTRLAASLVRTRSTPQELFRSLDVDHNNRLSKLELEQVILGLEPHLSRSEKESIWERFDTDRSGFVDLNEFCRALQEVNASALVTVEDKVRLVGIRFKENGSSVYQAFSVFDRNNDGFLNRDEWQRAISFLAPELHPSDVDAIFRQFDVDANGFISLAEFQDFFQRSMDSRFATAVPTAGALPTYSSPPVEAPWEREILDMLRDCFSFKKTGYRTTEVFRRLDISNSQTLRKYEFHRMLTTYRPGLTDSQMDSLFYKVNVSRSGAISLGEFVSRFG